MSNYQITIWHIQRQWDSQHSYTNITRTIEWPDDATVITTAAELLFHITIVTWSMVLASTRANEGQNKMAVLSPAPIFVELSHPPRDYEMETELIHFRDRVKLDTNAYVVALGPFRTNGIKVLIKISIYSIVKMNSPTLLLLMIAIIPKKGLAVSLFFLWTHGKFGI